jgi:DNA-binding transcriptional MerR regulator
MGTKKYHNKNPIDILFENKIITMQQLIKEIGCCRMTVLRNLKSHKHGYLTSYNFNARYYTMADIPEFDHYGLWTFQNVRFSKYGSLTNTITQLIAHSPKGLEIDEIEEILSVNVAPIVTKLFQKGCINRKKIGGTLFYFNHINKEMEKQLKKRQNEIREKISRLLPEPERIIAVLVDFIQNPRSQLFEIYLRLSTKGIKISQDDIEAIFIYYNLSKKKRLKY